MFEHPCLLPPKCKERIFLHAHFALAQPLADDAGQLLILTEAPNQGHYMMPQLNVGRPGESATRRAGRFENVIFVGGIKGSHLVTEGGNMGPCSIHAPGFSNT